MNLVLTFNIQYESPSLAVNILQELRDVKTWVFNARYKSSIFNIFMQYGRSYMTHKDDSYPSPADDFHILGPAARTIQASSRPPVVNSRDVKKMLACPLEEMHMFSDPRNYRTRPRYTRFALRFREIEGIIQVHRDTSLPFQSYCFHLSKLISHSNHIRYWKLR